MNTKRMLMAIKELRRVHKEKRAFYYKAWGKEAAADSACGTTACAAGWLTLYEPFKKMGLSHASSNLFPVFKFTSGPTALAAFLGQPLAQSRIAFTRIDKHIGKAQNSVTTLDVATYLEGLLSLELEKRSGKKWKVVPPGKPSTSTSTSNI